MSFSNEQVFCVNSTYARHLIKKRLIVQKLIPYECCECKNSGEWNTKPLVLQLDHSNGINNDNRLENLRFICPNCHSQTETYAGKNSAGVRHRKIKPNFRAEKRKRDKDLLEKIKADPSIRFGEWGWKTRFAEKLSISPQKVEKWIARVDHDFYITVAQFGRAAASKSAG